MPVWLAHLTAAWASVYSNSAVLRTSLGFLHVGGVLAGGGSAIAADRATLVAWRRDADSRLAHVRVLHGTHRLVLIGLVAVFASGLLLLGADTDTYLHSRVFWVKMAVVGLLLINGAMIVRAGRRAQHGAQDAWVWLRFGSIASLALWFLTTLLGTALPNV
jgi:uncharacterized membrane protein